MRVCGVYFRRPTVISFRNPVGDPATYSYVFLIPPSVKRCPVTIVDFTILSCSVVIVVTLEAQPFDFWIQYDMGAAAIHNYRLS